MSKFETLDTLEFAKQVIGEAFFGRADYEPEHRDIIIAQTWGGLVNTLAAHLSARLRPETPDQREYIERAQRALTTGAKLDAQMRPEQQVKDD